LGKRHNGTGCRLLVSVRDADEAQRCVQSGVDLIDIKEPANGAMGRASLDDCQAIARVVGPGQRLSVALGELHQWFAMPPAERDDVLQWLAQTAQSGTLGYVKVGLAQARNGDRWPSLWDRWHESLPQSVVPVAVAYADHHRAASPDPGEVLAHASQSKTRGQPGWLLIDTFDKQADGLLGCCSLTSLKSISESCQRRGVCLGLAGKLSIDDVATLAMHVPCDVIAVRGAACDGGRSGQVTIDRLNRLRSCIAAPRLLH
jgi:(5-formylfuran-3-yl)methyl phosphate synthase